MNVALHLFRSGSWALLQGVSAALVMALSGAGFVVLLFGVDEARWVQIAMAVIILALPFIGLAFALRLPRHRKFVLPATALAQLAALLALQICS